VEVLVALAVVAITLSAGLKAAGSLMNNAERLTDVTAAQWCADNQLTQLKLAGAGTPLSVGDSDFACEQLGRSYLGKLVVRPTPNPNFRRVEARISDAAGQPILVLTTVLPK
jgi:general secretion pathway protein I